MDARTKAVEAGIAAGMAKHAEMTAPGPGKLRALAMRSAADIQREIVMAAAAAAATSHARSMHVTFDPPPPMTPEDALEIRVHVRAAIDERLDGTLRAAWTSYHALALGTGHCDPRHLDTRCLGCAELERLTRKPS